MADPPDADALMRAAERLGRAARRRKPCALPPLFVLTDPSRTPDPLGVALRAPRGAGLIYRAFGAPDALEVARSLAREARSRGGLLLIGADERLAQTCGAAGVHLPERQVHRARAIRARWPGVLLTGAAHDEAALRRAAAADLDAVLLSKVFPSSSPSPGVPRGPVRFATLARRSTVPVYALGGMNVATASRLTGAGAHGFAAISAVLHSDTISCGRGWPDPPHSASRS